MIERIKGMHSMRARGWVEGEEGTRFPMTVIQDGSQHRLGQFMKTEQTAVR